VSRAAPDVAAVDAAILEALIRLRHRRRTATRPRRPRPLEQDWRAWLRTVMPRHFGRGFGPMHAELWEHLQTIAPGFKPDPFMALWARGSGKSTNAEAAAVNLGARGVRGYCWYVCGTQPRADDHVATIAGMLEAPSLAAHYPAMAEKALGLHGDQKGWRRNRLWTAGNFVVDALGLDVAARGAKLDERRPDLIILDDVDDRHDKLKVVARKIETIRDSILPSGSDDSAVLFVQNLIHADSVASQIVDGRAGILANRVVSGPHPALLDPEYEEREVEVNGERRRKWFVVAGTPTWPEGQGLDRCQAIIDESGVDGFKREAQHEVKRRTGGLYDMVTFHRCDRAAVPDLLRICVTVDPAVTDTEQSDAQGIQVDGITAHRDPRQRTLYRLYSWEQRSSPEDAIERAITRGLEYGADTLLVETDQGGDTWRSVVRVVVRAMREAGKIPAGVTVPRFVPVKAGASRGSKVERQQRMVVDYQAGRVVHVRGTHDTLEQALIRFGADPPFDLGDAAYWGWAYLTGKIKPPTPGGFAVGKTRGWTP
jgi:hypothetical protein